MSPLARQPSAIATAVLPFANISGDACQGFFSDGLTEEITSALAKVHALRIVARSSAFAFKNRNKEARVVGEALGATHLIEGSVRQAGNRLRITAQLIETDNGFQVWSESYDRELTDVFAIQEDIAIAIASALRVPLGLKQGDNSMSFRTTSWNAMFCLRAGAGVWTQPHRTRGYIMRTVTKGGIFTAISGMVILLAGASAHAQSAASCADIAKLTIAPPEIGLPTKGATISSAQIATVPASPRTPLMMRQYCKVLGAIAPVDPNAPPVNFEVNLPMEWNGKAVQYGGGGFNGTLTTGLRPLSNHPVDAPLPLARGFATWGTDSGHEQDKLPEIQAFALNDEALTNFAYASYKKTHDVARRIVMAFYGRPPSKIYYFGSSEGGREGLTMAQRFPSDFDGIVSNVPVINWTGLLTSHNHSGIVQQGASWLNPAKVAALRKAVNAACDASDGLADGVISAYEKCIEVFSPKALRCPGGADSADTCLSDAQIAAVDTLHHPLELGITLPNGTSSYPGANYGSEDQPNGMIQWITGTQPAQFPLPGQRDQGTQWYFGSGVVRYFFARDVKYNPLKFSPKDFAPRLREVSALMDSTDPDLSAYYMHGGKLIVKVHGADFGPSPFQSMNYYKSVVAKMGQGRVDSFMRLYVTPGANHGGNGTTSSGAAIPNAVDLLNVIDDWSNSGTTPNDLIQVSQEPNSPFKILSSRPMCRYPLYPHYNGGDPNKESSFSCRSQ